MRRLVFDSWLHNIVGDVGDNSTYWKPATITHIYKDTTFRGNGRGLWLANVKFDDGRTTHGHFISAFRKIPNV